MRSMPASPARWSAVVDPQMCGIAGFGTCGIYMPGNNFHGYIDAHAPAPLGARPDMWANLIESEARDGYGFILKGRLNDIGYKSICAPANLKMYYEAHKEHGSLPWSRIVEPAIPWAENGWTVRPHVHFGWADDGAFGRAPNHERTGFTPAARARYCRPDGMPKRVDDRSSIATTARPCAPSPKSAPMSPIPARSLRRSPTTCRRTRRCSRSRISRPGSDQAPAAVGRLSRLPGLDQPAAGRRCDADRRC